MTRALDQWQPRKESGTTNWLCVCRVRGREIKQVHLRIERQWGGTEIAGTQLGARALKRCLVFFPGDSRGCKLRVVCVWNVRRVARGLPELSYNHFITGPGRLRAITCLPERWVGYVYISWGEELSRDSGQHASRQMYFHSFVFARARGRNQFRAALASCDTSSKSLPPPTPHPPS